MSQGRELVVSEPAQRLAGGALASVSTKLAVLWHHAIRAAKRFFGVPDFRYCAIADGIREVMAGRRSAPLAFLQPERPSTRLHLAGLAHP